MINHLSKLLFKVLKGYGVPVSFRSIEQEINSHPGYPSMQCISDALDLWKVKHVVMQLTLEKLRALDVPVIAHLKRGEFVWVTQITESYVHYCRSTGKETKESTERFEEEWSGAALAFENINDAGDPDYKAKRKEEIREKIFKSLVICSMAVLLLLLTCFARFHDGSSSLLPKLLLLFSNAVGCYVSYQLVRQEKHQSSALSAKFCKAGKYIDCRKVTDSNYSTFFGVVSLAELGAAFFSSMLLWVAVAPLSDNWLPPLWWFSLLVLPFTLWSLTTQAFVIRKWCLFCCSVVFLLWVNAAILLLFFPRPVMTAIPEAAMLALLIIVSIVAVMEATKTIGSKARKYAQQREAAKIKYNIATIQSQLAEKSDVTDTPVFTFGCPDSQHCIGLYVSIACSHCRKAISEIKRLTEIYPDFCYRLIYAVNTEEPDDKTNAIIRHFIALYSAMQQDKFFEMLDVWYSMPEKTLEALQEAFPVTYTQDCQPEMDALSFFSRQFKISYTPAILLNGRLLSQIYSYKDLYGITRAFNNQD